MKENKWKLFSVSVLETSPDNSQTTLRATQVLALDAIDAGWHIQQDFPDAEIESVQFVGHCAISGGVIINVGREYERVHKPYSSGGSDTDGNSNNQE